MAGALRAGSRDADGDRLGVADGLVRGRDPQRHLLALRREAVNRTGFPGGPDLWKDGVYDEQDDTIEGVSGGAA